MSANTAAADIRSSGMISSAHLIDIERASSLGDGFKNFRQTAFGRSLALPMPDGSHELWRYTKPDGFGLQRLVNQAPMQFSLTQFAGGDSATPVTVPGISLTTGAAALERCKEAFAALLGDKSADLNSDAIAALQLATVSSIACVVISKTCALSEPVVLSQMLPSDLSASSLVVVVFERGAKAVLVEDLSGSPKGLIAPRVEVLVGDGADATFCSVQRFGGTVTYLARHRFHTGRDSKLSTAHLALGAKLSRVDIDLKMYEPGAMVDLVGAYLVDDNRHADMHPTQYHLAPHCRSDLFTKGVLRDTARSVYYGYIKVAEGAQKTDAYQTNRNLLLSQNARADSIPNLEIKANDVRCSHGASVSSVSAEDMFYLMARGLSRPVAEELLVEGFLSELLIRVQQPALNAWLSGLVIEQLQRRVK